MKTLEESSYLLNRRESLFWQIKRIWLITRSRPFTDLDNVQISTLFKVLKILQLDLYNYIFLEMYHCLQKQDKDHYFSKYHLNFPNTGNNILILRPSRLSYMLKFFPMKSQNSFAGLFIALVLKLFFTFVRVHLLKTHKCLLSLLPVFFPSTLV